MDRYKEELRDIVKAFGRRRAGCEHADVRIELDESRWATAECGDARLAERNVEGAFGVRVLARGTGQARGMVAPGYYGGRLGPRDFRNFRGLLTRVLDHAWKRARANAEMKARVRRETSPIGESLWSAALRRESEVTAEVPPRHRIDPRGVDLDRIVALAVGISREAMTQDRSTKYVFVSAQTGMLRQVYASTAGSLIDQSWTLTEGNVYVVVEKDGVTQEIYDTTGSNAGWEVLTEGVSNGYERLAPFGDFVQGILKDGRELCSAPPVPKPDQPVTMVTDPHYNTLLVHEIVGHPVELDRALKMETAYAGRTWLFGRADRHRLGERIASEKLSAYSDPTLPGYGHYEYDDEGTPGRKVMHIDRGRFVGFMNSRQTSAMLAEVGVDSPPNGHFKATMAGMVPLIRMSTTVFSQGDSDPAQIIRDVEHGYYLVGHKIPSISESRENFRISARKVYEIRNGEIGQLYRDGGMSADSREFFMNVDAVGTDFRLYPIPNCGKGQPMQTKRLGNGGPTLRSRARLV